MTWLSQVEILMYVRLLYCSPLLPLLAEGYWKSLIFDFRFSAPTLLYAIHNLMREDAFQI